MKHLIIFIATIMLPLLNIHAQDDTQESQQPRKFYIGYSTTAVNMRQGPSTTYPVMRKLPPRTHLFIDSSLRQNGFYKVIAIDYDIEGWVAVKYTNLYKEVPVNSSGTLQKTQTTLSLWPTIDITNDSKMTATIRINSKSYKFAPHEQRQIVSEPGDCLIIVSAKGVYPYVGADILENNGAYTWNFYLTRSSQSSNSETTTWTTASDPYYHKTITCSSTKKDTYEEITIKQAKDRHLKPCTHCYDIQ